MITIEQVMAYLRPTIRVCKNIESTSFRIVVGDDKQGFVGVFSCHEDDTKTYEMLFRMQCVKMLSYERSYAFLHRAITGTDNPAHKCSAPEAYGRKKMTKRNEIRAFIFNAITMHPAEKPESLAIRFAPFSCTMEITVDRRDAEMRFGYYMESLRQLLARDKNTMNQIKEKVGHEQKTRTGKYYTLGDTRKDEHF